MNYWLVKSEADCYSIDDLKRDKQALWGGVRNYQARNFLREMKKGDGVLYYHSSSQPMGVVGVAKVAADAVPEPAQFLKKDEYYDPKATEEKPIWFAPMIAFEEKFAGCVTLGEIKIDPKLSSIGVAQQGSRLSVQPVSETHFKRILELGKKKAA